MMTRSNSRMFATVVGMTALLGVGATMIPMATAQTPVATPTNMRMKVEKHPELIAAKKRLQASMESLQKAARDFDGHRAKAVELEKQAMAEIDLAIQSDKK